MTGGMHQKHRVIRRNGIEIRGGDIAMFSEFTLVPAGSGNPFARLGLRDFGLHPINNDLDRGRVRKLHPVQVVYSALSDVRVCVGIVPEWLYVPRRSMTRRPRPTAKLKLYITADLRDHSVLDHKSLCYRVVRIDGENVPMNENEVRL